MRAWCVPVCICGVVADTYVHMCACTNIVIVITWLDYEFIQFRSSNLLILIPTKCVLHFV